MAEQRSAWLTRRPAPALAGIVDRYVGYAMTGLEPGVHRGLPSRHLTFIVSIGPAIDIVAQTDPRQSPGSYGCVLSGLHASPALIAYGERQEGIALELTPAGCRALFGMPAAALYDTSLELADVAGAAGRGLWERLQGSEGWDARFAIVDEVLLRLVGDARIEPALGRCWQLVAGSGGTAPVTEVAASIGWTRQHLARRFAGEFGLTPKTAARVARFDRARRMLEARAATASIADVASACGYYDQAHLNRDFAVLAGTSPGRLVADDLPSFQDDEGAYPGR